MILVVATHNVKKGVEMTTILGGRFPMVTLKTLADYSGAPEPEETADTYQGNAVIKAQSALGFTKEWCVADDAGLEIDAMPGELSVYSKRFGGEDTTFDEKISMVLDRLKGVQDRAARFRCWVALARPGFEIETFEGILEGRIAEQRSGSYGFGYDPIFIPEGFDVTIANLTPEQKHAISHRGKVLAKLGDRLAALT